MDCSPGGENGNYIMFARATSGDKPNNNKFSGCSKDSMALVMEAKARHSGGCFIGNKAIYVAVFYVLWTVSWNWGSITRKRDIPSRDSHLIRRQF